MSPLNKRLQQLGQHGGPAELEFVHVLYGKPNQVLGPDRACAAVRARRKRRATSTRRTRRCWAVTSINNGMIEYAGHTNPQQYQPWSKLLAMKQCSLSAQETDIGETEVSLIRYFTIHNFKDGYIWAIYSNKAFESSGKQFDGSGRIPTKWKIHKENGKWEIVEIFEAP